jgi:glutaredoxin
MNKLTLLVLLSLGSLGFAGAANAEIYRWVDEAGRVHYSDHPPASVKDAKRVSTSENTVEGDRLPFATREAMKKNPVTLYATKCGAACDQARALLGKRSIPYTAKNPEGSQADAEALKQLVGALQVPVLVVGTQAPITGFEASAWEAALDSAGYPKTASLPGRGDATAGAK